MEDFETYFLRGQCSQISHRLPILAGSSNLRFLLIRGGGKREMATSRGGLTKWLVDLATILATRGSNGMSSMLIQ